MPTVTAFSLPGVYFLPAPRPAAVALPPLDVTGLVGFAARGPLDTPVPVEDLATFDAIFGEPIALARDATGKPVLAYLRDAVATFFSTGGRRAYIVRVAGAAARPARLPVPGIIAIDPLDDFSRAEIAASSPGVWGDALRLGAQLEATPLPAGAFTVAGDASLQWTTTGAPDAVQPGDVLRVAFADGTAFLLPATEVGASPSADAQSAVVVADRIWALYPTLPAAGLAPVTGVARLGGTGPEGLTTAATLRAPNNAIMLWLTRPDTLTLGVGDLVILDLADGSQLALTVADAQVVPEANGVSGPFLAVSVSELLVFRNAAGTGAALPKAPIARIDRLRLALAIKYGDADVREIASLGFNGGQPRFWGDIAVAESGTLAGGASQSSNTTQQQQTNVLAPGDATELYGGLFGTLRSDLDWRDPRLTTVLSTLLAPASGDGMLYLPVGMPAILTERDLIGADAGSSSDDLATFSAAPFLDARLSGGSALPSGAVTPATLLSAATDLFYLQDSKLKGIHGLTFVDEVALTAAPDAIQLGWAPQPSLSVPPPPVVVPATPSTTFSACAPPPSLLSVDPGSGSLSGGTHVTLTGANFRFAGDGAVTVVFDRRPATDVTIGGDESVSCVSPPGAEPGPVTVTVSNDNGSGSLAAGFSYAADATTPDLPTAFEPPAYAAATLPMLLDIQTNLIGLCQARNDAVAILALPLHFETQDCIAWLQGLRDALHLPPRGLSSDSAQPLADLSYAAIYHPWLLVPDPNSQLGVLRPVPPDGAACGAVAARELARGVWVAPANDPLPGVLDLQPDFTQDDWAQLFAVGFNLVRAEPRDFRFMSAHTLANDRRLLQLSVRRLMIQLRKAAFELGQDHVFARNDDLLRRRLQGGLETLLVDMFDRGAFAGATRDASYRITIDDTVNTRADFDQGRIIAQILVAPSQPMEFLTVLLTRSGDGQLQAAEG